MTFKDETIKVLNNNGKSVQDIRFVQCCDFRFSNSIEEILNLMNFEYDSGYGHTEIPEDLVIVGEDWWLERHEYDDAEWWEYKQLPKPLETMKRVTAITNGSDILSSITFRTEE